MRILGISGSLRRDSHNSTLLRAAADLLPPGAELVVYDGLKAIPPFDADDEDAARRGGARAPRGDRGRGRGPDRHAGVQQLDPGRPQERPRLGLAAARPTPPCATSPRP